MPPPTFSVILPTYNRAHLVGQAIQSILTQTFTNFELLVIDDASTDQTSAVVTSFEDPRLRYLQQVQNGGVSLARNRGLNCALGEYIAFIDDDDTIEPTFLAEVHAVFSTAPPTVGFLWTWKYVTAQTELGVSLDRKQTYNIDHSRPLAGADYLSQNRSGSGGLVVRLSVIQEIGNFNPEFHAHEDNDFLLRLANRFDFVVVPQYLYTIFEHKGERLSALTLECVRSFDRVTEMHLATFQRFPALLNNRYRLLGMDYYRLGERRAGRKYLYKSLQGQPFKVKRWIAFLLFELYDYLPLFIQRELAKRH